MFLNEIILWGVKISSRKKIIASSSCSDVLKFFVAIEGRISRDALSPHFGLSFPRLFIRGQLNLNEDVGLHKLMWIFLGFQLTFDEEIACSWPLLVVPNFNPVQSLFDFDFEGRIREQYVLGFCGGLNLILAQSNQIELCLAIPSLKVLHVANFEIDVVDLSHFFVLFN